MKKLLFIAGAGLLFYSFGKTVKSPETLPDPDAYLLQVFECLRKNDTTAYLKLQPSFSDFKFAVEHIEPNTEKPINEEEIAAGLIQYSKQSVERFKRIVAEAKNYAIDWSKISAVRTVYDIEKESPSFVALMSGDVLFTYNNGEYRIRIQDVALIKGRWVGGAIREMISPFSKRDEDYYEYNYAPVDSVTTAPKKD